MKPQFNHLYHCQNRYTDSDSDHTITDSVIQQLLVTDHILPLTSEGLY